MPSKAHNLDELLDAAVQGIAGVRRPGQVEMVHAVADAIAKHEHLLVQAGTGTGKSLAYLIPAVVHAFETGRPTVVATATLTLQAQIVDFDMPQGVLHVATRGDERFQVHGHAVEPSGLITGQVTPIAAEPRVPLAEAFAPLASLLELVASRVGPQNFPAENDYGDATWVGYRLAEVLPLPLHIKQSMLEVNDAAVRLKVLQQFLARQGLI